MYEKETSGTVWNVKEPGGTTVWACREWPDKWNSVRKEL